MPRKTTNPKPIKKEEETKQVKKETKPQVQKQQIVTSSSNVKIPNDQELKKMIETLKLDPQKARQYIDQFIQINEHVEQGNISNDQLDSLVKYIRAMGVLLSKMKNANPNVFERFSKKEGDYIQEAVNYATLGESQFYMSEGGHRGIIQKSNIGEKQEDNFQIQFMNAMLTYLAKQKTGINQQDLQTLAQVKTENAITSDNLPQFQKRFTDYLKQNPDVRGLFVRITPLIQQGIVTRIQKSQQQPEKKQQQQEQLQTFVDNISEGTKSRISSTYIENKEETKSEQSGFSLKSINSDKFEKRSFGQQSQIIRTQNRSEMNESEYGSQMSERQQVTSPNILSQKSKIGTKPTKQLEQQIKKQSLQSRQNQAFSNQGANQGPIRQFGDLPNNNAINTFVPQSKQLPPNNLIPGANPFRNQFDALFQRFEDTAKKTQQPAEVIQRIRQMKQNILTANEQAKEESKQAEVVQVLQEQNASDIARNQNQASDLASVSNKQSIIDYRDVQEEQKENSLILLANNEKYKKFIQKYARDNNLTSQQIQLVENALTGDNLLQNILMDSLEKSSHKYGNELELQPANSYKGKRSASQGKFKQELQQNLQNDNFDFDNFFEINKDYIKDNISDKQEQNPGESPFNQWATMLQNRANKKVDLSKPFLAQKKGIPLTKITGDDLALYLFNAIKFAGEISGPISNVILKTYQKQTSVFKDKIVKQESTQFKVKPGAMFRLRCCD